MLMDSLNIIIIKSLSVAQVVVVFWVFTILFHFLILNSKLSTEVCVPMRMGKTMFLIIDFY